MKRIDINAEKYKKKPGLDLEFVSKGLNKAIKAKVDMTSKAETTTEVVKAPMPQRLRPSREDIERNNELLRQEQAELEEQALEREQERMRRILQEEMERLRNAPTTQQKRKGLRI
jgi:hypothetical protein